MFKIKNLRLIAFIIFLICQLLPLNFITTYAESLADSSGLNESLQDALENLDLSDLEKYFATTNFADTDLKTRILDYIKGGSVEYETFFEQLFIVFFNEIIELLPIFCTIVAIALLCGILSELQATTLNKQLGLIIETVGFSAALIPILQIFSECFLQTENLIAELRTQMELFFPILLTLLAASGGSVSVAVCKPSVAFLSTTLVSLIYKIVLPITLLIFAFSIINKLSVEFKMSKFIGVFKSINKWTIGIGVSIFGLFFTVQGITAVAYDGIARRAAKYAIGNGIPIVGGFLSGGFDLAVAGSILIKNSLGYLGIMIMVSSIFEPLILLCAVTILLRCCSGITAPLSANKISDFLSDTADSLNYLNAGILFTAFLYFLCIVIFISSTGVFF